MSRRCRARTRISALRGRTSLPSKYSYLDIVWLPIFLSIRASTLRRFPEISPALRGRYQYFPWEKCRVSSRETRKRERKVERGCGTPRGRKVGKLLSRSLSLSRRVIFFRRASLTSILSISTFPRRVSCRSAVSFSIYPRRLLSHFSFCRNQRVGEWTRENTTDKTKICIAARARTRAREDRRQVRGRESGERLINGLLAEGGCIIGEKKLARRRLEAY